MPFCVYAVTLTMRDRRTQYRYCSDLNGPLTGTLI